MIMSRSRDTTSNFIIVAITNHVYINFDAEKAYCYSFGVQRLKIQKSSNVSLGHAK